MEHLNGLLLVNKPRNMTSFGVVSRVRGIIKAETGKKLKVGHCGTLDPLADGLMIIVIGSYTKRAEEFTKKDKTYKATLQLGIISTTADEEGEKTEVSKEQPEAASVVTALDSFVGEIEQTPPIYSAVKINGERAYRLARKGKEVAMPTRKVTIYSIEDSHYSYPELSFTVSVSSGTYIRSLVTDIGTTLGVGAYMTALTRTDIGGFKLAESIAADDLTFKGIYDNIITTQVKI